MLRKNFDVINIFGVCVWFKKNIGNNNMIKLVKNIYLVLIMFVR